MSTDPARAMHQLTDRVQHHYGTILAAWDTPDPDWTLPRSGGDGRRDPSKPSDPTGTAAAAAERARMTLLHQIARHTLQLGELLSALGFETLECADYVTHIATAPLEQRSGPTRRSMEQLLAVHRGWWRALHDLVVAWAGQPTRWDDAVKVVRFMQRDEHNLQRQLRNLASSARQQLVRPDHPDAGKRRPCACDGWCCPDGCDDVIEPKQDRKRMSTRCLRRQRTRRGSLTKTVSRGLPFAPEGRT